MISNLAFLGRAFPPKRTFSDKVETGRSGECCRLRLELDAGPVDMVSGSLFMETHRYSGLLRLEESRGRPRIKIGLIKTDLILPCEYVSAAGV